MSVTEDGREVPIDRCVQRWRAHLATLATQTCSPVMLRVMPERPAAMVPASLDVPADIVVAVQRSGRSKMIYPVDSCDPTAATTGFPELDRRLRALVSEFHLDDAGSADPCVATKLVLSRFECETQ